MNWEALGGDPVAGDVDAARRVASAFGQLGAEAEVIFGRLRSVDGGTGPQVWRGEAADAFRDLLAKLGPDLTKLAESHHRADEALIRYAVALDGAQVKARQAGSQAEVAVHDRTAADTRRARAADEAASNASTVRLAQVNIAQARVQQVVGAHDPVYQAQWHEYEAKVSVQRDLARSRETQARGQESAARSAVNEAEARLTAAKSLARQAQQMRDGAARTAAQTLDEAGRAGVEHRNIFQRTMRRVNDFARDITSRPEFHSFLNILSNVGDVLSALATVAAFIPGMQGVAAGLLVAGAAFKGAAFLGTLLAGAYGNASKSQMVGRGLDFGLSIFSAGKAIQGAKKVALAGKAANPLAGQIKRAIWYDDARRATGAMRSVHAADRLGGIGLKASKVLHVKPSTFFRVQTGATVVHKASKAWEAGETLGKSGVQLVKDIRHFHDPTPQDSAAMHAPRAAKTATGELVTAVGQRTEKEGVAKVVSFVAKPAVKKITEELVR